MIEAIISGFTLGLGSGAAPGPLTGLAITTTMRSGLQAGLRIALAPLLSDALIIFVTLSVISNIPERGIHFLGLVGAVVVSFFGIETLVSARHAEPPSSGVDAIPKRLDRFPRLLQGAIVNALNPAPWIFWATAGSTLLIGYWNDSPASAVLFLIVFYIMLVGIKVLLVLGLAATRHRMNVSVYRGILFGSGVLLVIAGVLLFVSNISSLTN